MGNVLGQISTSPDLFLLQLLGGFQTPSTAHLPILFKRVWQACLMHLSLLGASLSFALGPF